MCFYMVGAVRLELTTYRLKADYSNQLSYAPIYSTKLILRANLRPYMGSKVTLTFVTLHAFLLKIMLLDESNDNRTVFVLDLLLTLPLH